MPAQLMVSKGGVQFEEDYIYRSNRSITSTPDIALTELVANAWDAGAFRVSIVIPYVGEDGKLVVEDDGTGMSDDEFHQRWMTLNYNRQKRQGKEVVFPDNEKAYKRIAYGRNGIGRHGMLCFNTMYCVETWKDGVLNIYDISVSSGNEPFKIVSHIIDKKVGHGTRLSTCIEDKVHRRLSKRLENISDVFGQIPDVLEDVWNNVALGEEEKALQLIDEIPEKHPFENRYNRGVEHIDWESCSQVLDKKEKRRYLEKGW